MTVSKILKILINVEFVEVSSPNRLILEPRNRYSSVFGVVTIVAIVKLRIDIPYIPAKAPFVRE